MRGNLLPEDMGVCDVCKRRRDVKCLGRSGTINYCMDYQSCMLGAELVEDREDPTVPLEEVIDLRPTHVPGSLGAVLDMLKIIEDDASAYLERTKDREKTMRRRVRICWLLVLLPLASTIYAFTADAATLFLKIASIASLALSIAMCVWITVTTHGNIKKSHEARELAAGNLKRSRASADKIHRKIAS